MINKFEKKPDLITGLGNIEGAGLEKKLPVIEVKNEVVWVNNDVEMPFRFEEGKQSKIGVFLTAPNELEPDFYVKVMDNHFRSALLGKVIFRDKEGNLYRDVDIKGMGAINPESGNLETEIIEKDAAKKFGRGKTPWGFLDWGYAETDRDMSEFFVNQGLRTHRALAIIRLDEIVVEEGEKISVSKARKLGYIKYTTEPVIEVRAFGTKARIADIGNKVLIEDAKHMVAQELGEDLKNFSDEKYLKWFAQTLGKQVAIIHNAGFIHEYLTEHNIALDCRIVDLDSVKKVKRFKSFFKDERIMADVRMAILSMKKLCLYKASDIPCRNLGDEFFNNYVSNSSLASEMAPEIISIMKELILNEFF